jgi:hypothetical protein
MPTSKNLVALAHGLAIVPSPAEESMALAASVQAELMQLGFMLDADAFTAACKAPKDWLVAFHGEVLLHLCRLLGAGHKHEPFYRNFPAEVMSMTDAELWWNARFHYASDGTWEPPQEIRGRGFAFETTKFNVLRLGTEADLLAVFTRLAALPQSLTEQDRAAVDWFVREYGRALPLPEVVPFRETFCILAAHRLDVPVRSATDVLRIALHLSGADPGLTWSPGRRETERAQDDGCSCQACRERRGKGRDEGGSRKPRGSGSADSVSRPPDPKACFGKFTREERRYLLGLVEKTGRNASEIASEMQRHLGRWLRLGERLHPGEFANRFPKTAEAFRTLRNQGHGTHVRSYGGRVDLAFKADWREGLALLAKRPGELQRRLDWLLRTFDPATVLETFLRAGHGASTKVILEVRDHFAARAKPGAPRTIMLKGRRARQKTLPPLPPIGAATLALVRSTIAELLRARAAKRPPLGKVWIDERLRGVPAPTAMRSASAGARTLVRGTRVPYRAEAKVVRAFVHWYDEHGYEDLDLSAGFYRADRRRVGHVSWTNLNERCFGCCHSGDIRHRQGACAEYVDIDIERCLKHGVRYVAVEVLNYDGRPLRTVKDCVFGLMEREHPVAGEIFVPRTISDCIAVENDSTAAILAIVDLGENCYLWADLEGGVGANTIEGSFGKLEEVMHSLLDGTRLSLYELMDIHVRARGVRVERAEEADVVWRWEDFAFDYTKAAEFLAI